MSTDNLESNEIQDQPQEWERILNEEKGLTLSQRKANQLDKLQQIVGSLHSHFGTNLIASVKKIRGDTLNPEESRHLQENPNQEELQDRVKGLIKEFYKDFYKSLEAVSGVSFIVSEEPPTDLVKKDRDIESATAEADMDSTKVAKLPKGFNKWDLKLIKLHESRPNDGKRMWVEFWSLKGLTGVGEILFNPTKNLFYFRPYDSSNQSFAMTDGGGRKATAQARNYYFRVCPNPPEED
ncbi:MAG: hypothetical protein MJE63_22115 [Proteobacteria bacterium]|nr:hypothetical protein [Pseudomonadota bacterium]